MNTQISFLNELKRLVTKYDAMLEIGGEIRTPLIELFIESTWEGCSFDLTIDKDSISQMIEDLQK